MKIVVWPLSLIILAGFSQLDVARADYIVAGNLSDTQTSCDYWEEVGFIAPLQTGDNNDAKGQAFIPVNANFKCDSFEN